ncbi:hypothetical protein ACJMK2_007326 [Sinanodonta woodiana]|uniref:Uncharacterized protein n=1 Tax=Sinanodonta woodiana TaxID=1069815 RepID=A0ABD3VL67_SINWO
MENAVVRAVLLKNEELLRRHLVLSRTVIKKLRDNGIITEYTGQKLLIQRGEDQIQTLLFPLKIKDLRTLQKFIDVLKETHHRWIAEVLLETDIESGRRTAVDLTKSLRYWLARQDKSGTLDSDLNERLIIPLSTLTSLSKTRNGLTTHLDGVNQSNGYISAALERARNQRLTRTKNGYANLRFQIGEGQNRKGSISSRVPEKLRELERTFESESTNNRSLLSVLKQEELAIRAHFRQNQQEQREIEQKQKDLSELQGRMRDLEERFVNMYRPTPKERDAFHRLRRL